MLVVDVVHRIQASHQDLGQEVHHRGRKAVRHQAAPAAAAAQCYDFDVLTEHDMSCRAESGTSFDSQVLDISVCAEPSFASIGRRGCDGDKR